MKPIRILQLTLLIAAVYLCLATFPMPASINYYRVDDGSIVLGMRAASYDQIGMWTIGQDYVANTVTFTMIVKQPWLSGETEWFAGNVVAWHEGVRVIDGTTGEDVPRR